MSRQLQYLYEEFGKKAVDAAIERVIALDVEVPSWGFGRGGTRFAVYVTGLEASAPGEKIAAAGRFNRLTGKGKTVALHFPWDGSTKKDVGSLKKYLAKAGLKASSINANLFSPRPKGPLDANMRFGTLTNPDKAIRKASIAHMLECMEYMRLLGSDTLVLWLPDGANSPGQMSFFDQADRLDESLKSFYRKIRKGEKLLIEYKLFEPATYSTAIQDYARSLELCRLLGDRAFVLVDLGHHAHGVNVEQIVSNLLRQGRLGGFHFNDRCYADDDMATGSVNPHQLFRIFCVMVEAEIRGYTPVKDVAFMIDQSHNVKDPFEELIESLENIETAYAKSLLVDYKALREARDACDPTLADDILQTAFSADVRPIKATARRKQGLPVDPLSAARGTHRQ